MDLRPRPRASHPLWFGEYAKYLGIAWSPDSRRLGVGIQRDGAYVVYAKAIGESAGEELLFRSSFELSLIQWLPNGGLMLMLRDPKTDWDVAYLPPRMKGVEPEPVPLIQGEASEASGMVSPDGRWIAYQSNESSGERF